MTRVTADDLAFAAEWLDGYDAASDDDNGPSAARVADWLRAEIARREGEATVRKVAKHHGVSAARARKALAARQSATR